MSTKTMKLAGILLGATIMTATAAYAGQSDAKCGASKCGGDSKKMEKTVDTKGSTETKKMMKKVDGKCGASKCGADSKKMEKKSDAKCGASKCGSK